MRNRVVPLAAWLAGFSCACGSLTDTATGNDTATGKRSGEPVIGVSVPEASRPATDVTLLDTRAAHLLVQVRETASSFEVVRVTRVELPLQRHRGRERQAGWMHRAFGRDHALVGEGFVSNPRLVRGEFPDPGTGAMQHVVSTQSGPVDFIVRVPLGTLQIDFFDAAPRAPRAAALLGSVKLAEHSP